MRTFEKYDFKLIATPLNGGTPTEHIVHPSYDSLKLKYAKESGEMYFNKTIDTEFVFTNEDFVTIMSYPLLTEFELQIVANNTIVTKGTFRKTDCDVDVNAMKIITKVSQNTLYDNLKAKLNDEYDLIKFGLQKRDVNFIVNPVVQYAQINSTSVVNVVCGEHFYNNSPTMVSGLDNITFEDKDGYFNNYYKVRASSFFTRIVVPHVNGYTFEGTYEYCGQAINQEHESPRYGDEFKFEFRRKGALAPGYKIIQTIYTQTFGNKYVYMKLEMKSDNPDEYIAVASEGEGMIVYRDYQLFRANELIFVRTNPSGDPSSTPLFHAEVKMSAVVSRLFSNKIGSVGDLGIHYLRSDDPFFTSHYFNRFQPNISEYHHIYRSDNFANENKGYGNVKGYDDRFYDKPQGNLHKLVPIFQDCWGYDYSYWLSVDENSYSTDAYNKDEVCHDAYNIGDVIKALLKEIDKGIVFEPTEHYSYFLFSGTKIQGDIRITPKTNIMYTGYDYPAWKAPIHLEDVFGFLKNALNCYWYLDGNELHIEHIEYFLNGMSYSVDRRNIIRLNERLDPYNGKSQSYRTNNWKYDGGGKQTTRIEFSWMDNSGEIFDDYPIIVPKQYRIGKDEATENRDVKMFTSNINHIIAMSEETNKDGFAVMQTMAMSGDNADDICTQLFTIGTTPLLIQNFYLSFYYIIGTYMLYNIASSIADIHDGTLVAINGIRRARLRTNEVTFQYNKDESVSPMEIIETEVGNGNIESLELDLSSNTATAKLTYELE